MPTTITAIGNAGFQIVSGGLTVLIDAFYHPALWVGAPPHFRGDAVRAADLILVTHAHADHFHPEEIVEVARRTQATVAGPKAAIQPLAPHLPAASLITLEPPEAGAHQSAQSQFAECRGSRITAFRTFHARGHNSYLVEMPSFRFFHDGDNEDTRRVDPALLRNVNALLIGPWNGSGWVEFIEALQPQAWFLIHLTLEELAQHRAGTFLPELCDHIPLPDRLVVLAPGESWQP